jgi:hypothetical protein
MPDTATHKHVDHAILRHAQDKLPRLSGIVGWHSWKMASFRAWLRACRRVAAFLDIPYNHAPLGPEFTTRVSTTNAGLFNEHL